jgi:hypothetical protein
MDQASTVWHVSQRPGFPDCMLAAAPWFKCTYVVLTPHTIKHKILQIIKVHTHNQNPSAGIHHACCRRSTLSSASVRTSQTIKFVSTTKTNNGQILGVRTSSCEVTLVFSPDFTQNRNMDTNLCEYPKYKISWKFSGGTGASACRQTEWRTKRKSEANSRISQLLCRATHLSKVGRKTFIQLVTFTERKPDMGGKLLERLIYYKLLIPVFSPTSES